MSGIEIVGIVLGALPIMINGIEKYSDGLSAARRLLHPRKELRNIHRAIRTELQVFRNTAVILLHRIATEAQVRALVQEPTSVLWKTPGFEAQMKSLLGSSYFIWCEVMADVSNAIKEIAVELGLPCNESRQPSSVGDVGTNTRLRITFRRSHLECAIARIRAGNESFVRLTDQAVALTVITSKKRAAASPDFQKSRQAARKIFTTLDSGLQCRCKPDHVLCLGLRSGRIDVPSLDNTHAHEHYRIVLAVRSNIGLATETEYVADIEMQIACTGSDACTASTPGVHTSSNRPGIPGRVVTCACLDFLASNDMVLSSASIMPPMTGPSKPRHIVVPVQTLLPVSVGQKGRLRARGRRQIALMASWNLLRLYSTPWLQDHIYWNGIGLIQGHDGGMIDLPFISKELIPSIGVSRQPLSADPVSLACIRNEWVYALGVFLIELCLGKSILQLKEPDDEIPGGMLPFLTEFRTASRLIEVVEDQAGLRYGAAVRRCVRCDFDERVYSLDDEGFCKAVYKGVVACLEDDIQQIDGDGEGVLGSGSLCF